MKNLKNIIIALFVIAFLSTTLSLFCSAKVSGYEHWCLPLDKENLMSNHVLSEYGPRSGGYHYGIDFRWSAVDTVDTPIYAVDGGTVIESSYESGFDTRGYFVTIQHDSGTKTRYIHMKYAPKFKQYDPVSQGAVLGYVGRTGTQNSAGPTAHLHLDLYRNGTRVNPRPYFEGLPRPNFAKPTGSISSVYPVIKGRAYDDAKHNATVRADVYVSRIQDWDTKNVVSGQSFNKLTSHDFSHTPNWNNIPAGKYYILLFVWGADGSGPVKTVKEYNHDAKPTGSISNISPTITGRAYDDAKHNATVRADVYVSKIKEWDTKNIVSGQSFNKLTSHDFSHTPNWNNIPAGKYYILLFVWGANGKGPVQITREYNHKFYKVNFNANGGSGAPDVISRAYGTTFTVPTSKQPTRAGYSFLGYSKSSTATTASYVVGKSYEFSVDTTTLYAVWKSVDYSVTYDANGGTGAPTEQKKVHGVALTLSTVKPTREGHYFLHWTDGTKTYTSGGMYEENKAVKLTAVWEPATYFIMFQANGGTMPVSLPFVQKTHGVDYVIPAINPIRSGYVFVGWEAITVPREKPDPLFIPGGRYNINKDVAFIAKWIEEESFTFVKGDINGDGVVDMADVRLGMQIVVGVPVSSDVPLGWNWRGDVDDEIGISAYDVRLILLSVQSGVPLE